MVSFVAFYIKFPLQYRNNNNNKKNEGHIKKKKMARSMILFVDGWYKTNMFI